MDSYEMDERAEAAEDRLLTNRKSVRDIDRGIVVVVVLIVAVCLVALLAHVLFV